jgi:hypothetical protein
MRETYLKLATWALVVGAALDGAAKKLWLEPAMTLVKQATSKHNWRECIELGLRVAGLVIVFKLVSKPLMWLFNRFQPVRVLIDSLFQVEGIYLEAVYVNDELEVVGFNKIFFSGGELHVHARQRRVEQKSDQTFSLSICADVVSSKELCTASDSQLNYVFEDVYTDSSLNKKGITTLYLVRVQNPSWFTRLFRRTPIECYRGSFTSEDGAIKGRINGRKLSGRELAKATGSDEAQNELLEGAAKSILATGTVLRKEVPGVALPKQS